MDEEEPEMTLYRWWAGTGLATIGGSHNDGRELNPRKP